MNHSPEPQKSGFICRVLQHYSGALTPIALSALSAWMIVTGLKGLAGLTVTRQSALADLLGIVIVIAALRFVRARSDSR